MAAWSRGKVRPNPAGRQRLPRARKTGRAGTRHRRPADVQRRGAFRDACGNSVAVTTIDGGLIAIGVVVAAYLWGGIPTAYLAARIEAGIDIRKYGSGNVGASNALVQLGTKAGVAIGLFDLIGKGILPVLLIRAFDASLTVQVAVALAAVAGHNWSPYLRFTGGRGVSVAGGVVLAFALWHEAAISTILIVALGRLAFKDTGLFTLIAIVALPVTTLSLGALSMADRPLETVLLCTLICAMLVAKRLIANWERPIAEQPVIETLLCRMLWDRDVRHKQGWTERMPNADTADNDTPAADTSEAADR
ncbi:MAG: hypothetical protein F4Y44_02225 [Chloroflexi bacterium]|nr:hypothetical protein [Chloroflexota bacterium]